MKTFMISHCITHEWFITFQKKEPQKFTPSKYKSFIHNFKWVLYSSVNLMFPPNRWAAQADEPAAPSFDQVMENWTLVQLTDL
jgi:hypothetical protein